VVAKWLAEPGKWIIEGVTVARGIRRWLAAHPKDSFPAAIVVLEQPRQRRTKGQRTMAKGVMKVWSEIEPELIRRGATIIRQRKGQTT
jgi:hypothetical protein